MESEPSKNKEEKDIEELNHQEQAKPVCLNCFQPIDPLDDYCPNCGAMVGNFTPYIPVRNIRWSIGIFGKIWRQAWSRNTSIKARLIKLIIIIFWLLILLKII